MLTEFERKAWDSRSSCEQHKPEMACKAVVDQIERNELENVRHVVVVVVEALEDGDMIHILQAGDLSQLAVEGALQRAIRLSNQP